MRPRPTAPLAIVVLLLAGFAPASSTNSSTAGAPAPVVASDNVRLVGSIPDIGAISTAFSSTQPFMYVNTVDGLSVYDISDPQLPVPTGRVGLPHFENEGMDIGERADGTTFVLVGIDIFATETGVGGGQPGNGPETKTANDYLYVVDVTDPSAPFIRSELDTVTSTHTVQCADPACTYAYTSGIYDDEFEVIDLHDLDAPSIVATRAITIGGSHQWTPDDAGIVWGASWVGAAAMDVSDPVNPVTLNTTDENGGRTPYNDFILHNVDRPNALAFEQQPVHEGNGGANRSDKAKGPAGKAPGDRWRLRSGSAETASVFDGNVLLVTEEDYDSPICPGGAGEGTFSTWWIPYLDAQQAAADNPPTEEFPNGSPTGGTITPLDHWNTEILDSGQGTVAGALCSAHYFTFHDAGFVAQGWYQQGTRILDVRDAHDIKQVGYFFTGDTETWHAYWVPERDEDGVVTGRDSNLVYTNDVARGIDILEVDLPTETAPAETADLTAPILPRWREVDAATAFAAPSSGFGFACRLAAPDAAGGVLTSGAPLTGTLAAPGERRGG